MIPTRIARPPFGKLVLLAFAMGALAGCDQLFQNHNERKLDIADKKYAQGEYHEAVLMYEASLDGSPKTADLHYKLALIYDDQLKQPISALHHFQRYLDLAPGGSHAKEARGFMKEDQLKLAATLGNGATVPQEEAVRLKNDNLDLRKKILELRTELTAASHARALALKNGGGKNGAGKSEQVQKDLVPGVRTYTVEPHDTLGLISLKFYKTKARWKDIQDANFNTLEGTAKLQPGMVLMIP